MSRQQMMWFSNANVFIDEKSDRPILFPTFPSNLFDVPFYSIKCHCEDFNIWRRPRVPEYGPLHGMGYVRSQIK